VLNPAGVCGWLNRQHWQARGAAAESSGVQSARGSAGKSIVAAAAAAAAALTRAVGVLVLSERWERRDARG
jgi:hypothetical protein